MPLPSWISRLFRRPEPEPDVRRNLIFLDVTFKSSLTVMFKHQLGNLLYNAALERGLAASSVDFETFIYERLLKARKFDDSGKRMAEMMGESWVEEAFYRSDIMWLMRHRDQLMREAFSAGGDAEYVFMMFQGNPEDLFLSMNWDINKRLIKVHYASDADTNFGSYVVVDHAGMSTPFKMSEDAWTEKDITPILDHIIKICQAR